MKNSSLSRCQNGRVPKRLTGRWRGKGRTVPIGQCVFLISVQLRRPKYACAYALLISVWRHQLATFLQSGPGVIDILVLINRTGLVANYKYCVHILHVSCLLYLDFMRHRASGTWNNTSAMCWEVYRRSWLDNQI